MKDAGPYTVISRLGEGGMAEVFKAIKQGPDGFEKPIALKRILPQLADNPSFIKMLSVEARIMAMLDHPNLVHVSDFFMHDKTFFMALEFVDGHNLRRIIKDSRALEHPIPWPAAVHIICETLKGLDYAHKRRGPSGPLNIVHRDVSPQNILVSQEGWVKLSDFGIARANVVREETKSGVLKGKQGYLSPEQLRSREVDFRSDLFSAAVVLYEMLTGQHPFETDNDYETMTRIVEAKYKPLIELRPDLPTEIIDAVTRTLNSDPSNRPADAAEFRTLLLSGQQSRWISSGTEELSRWLSTLYPEGSEADEKPLERTPLLSRSGTPIPFQIEKGQSMISSTGGTAASRFMRRRELQQRVVVWSFVIFLMMGVGYFFSQWNSSKPILEPLPPVKIVERNPLVAAIVPAPTAMPQLPTAIPTTKPVVRAAPKIQKPKVASIPKTGNAIVKEQPAIDRGHVQFSGPEGTEVHINGRRIGRLPIQGVDLFPGTYIVLMVRMGQPSMVTRVVVHAGEKSLVAWKTP